MRRTVILLATVVAMLLLAGGVALVATLLRGTGEDEALNGTRASDVIHGFGGKGDDTIASLVDKVTETGRVRDHVRDYVYCGAGSDTVYADKTDFVASDCERVAGEA
jgi:hypothetical protein